MKKILKRFFATCLILSIIFNGSCVPAFAYVCGGTQNASGISISNDNFKNAGSPVYSVSSGQLHVVINKSYDVFLFHYKAPVSGYYEFYSKQVFSTSNVDAYGAIFEVDKGLFKTSYKQIAFNDDYGSSSDFRIVAYLDKNKDYYFAARVYGKNTGTFNVVFEQNDDAITSNCGAKWVSDSASYGNLTGSYAYEVFSKEYLTKEQVKLYYQVLRNDLTQATLRNAYTQNGYVGVVQTLSSAGFTGVNVLTIAASLAGGGIAVTLVGAALTLTQGIMDLIIDSYYLDTKETADAMNQLKTVAGAGYIMQNGADVYYANSGVCITYTGKTVDGWVSFQNTYSAYNSQTLKGELLENGHWE